MIFSGLVRFVFEIFLLGNGGGGGGMVDDEFLLGDGYRVLIGFKRYGYIFFVWRIWIIILIFFVV